MKYLNEAKHISELQEICEEQLIDLIDKDFNVDMSYHGYLIIDKKNAVFQWSDVSDNIINFIEVSKDELEIKSLTISFVSAGGGYLRDIKLHDVENFESRNKIADVKIYMNLRK